MVGISLTRVRRLVAKVPTVTVVTIVTFVVTLYLIHPIDHLPTERQVNETSNAKIPPAMPLKPAEDIRPVDTLVDKVNLEPIRLLNEDIKPESNKNKPQEEPKAAPSGQLTTQPSTTLNKSTIMGKVDFKGFNNVTGANQTIVPNIIHFIHYNKTELTFVDYVVLRAAMLNHRPEKIFIHTNLRDAPRTGKYWEWVTADKKLWRMISFVFLELPSKIFGQTLSDGWRLHHASDIGRILLLMNYGGIYLDNDVYVIQNLDKYRKYEFVLNWDDDQFMGTQVLIAHKDARFLREWLSTYKQYRPDLWYYNAGERPTTEVLAHRPELIHRVQEKFGARTGTSLNLYTTLGFEWRQLETIHLLINHRIDLDDDYQSIPVFNETNILSYKYPFGEMAREVMGKPGSH